MDPELFERVLKRIRQFSQASDKNKPIARDWFDIARDDIKITELLIQKKHYAAAAYHLQQGFEKITKCYYILSGTMDPEQARDHKFVLKGLKKTLKEEYIDNILELSKLNTCNKVNLEESKNTLDTINKSEEQWRVIKEKEIKRIIDLIGAIEERFLNHHFIKSIEKKVRNKKNLKGIRHLILKITHFRTSYSQVKQWTDNRQIKQYIRGMIISIKLQFLSIITCVHYNTPRYPTIKNSNVNYKAYSENLGVINKIDEFIRIFYEVSDSIEQQHFQEK